MLSGIDAIHMATVIDDCVDQMAILGHIMPVTFDIRQGSSQLVKDEIDQIIDTQRDIESQYETVQQKKVQMKQQISNQPDMPGMREDRVKAAQNLTGSITMVKRNLKQSPLTEDNLIKIQQDRGFAQGVLEGTLHELIEQCGFQYLIDAVRVERMKKAQLQKSIQKEADGRKQIKQLTKAISDVKRDKEVEVKQRNEMIAHLKDQLQEMKAKTSMEAKYIKKCAEVGVAQTVKRCTLKEKELKDKITDLKRKVDEETRVNAEIESYLRTHQSQLEKALEHWMEKYDKDVDAKQHELDVLKASKARDLERLQDLSVMYKEYEQVVVEDRINKEKVRRKAEQDMIELRASIRIQAWWRGNMVRAGLGPFAKKKKKGKGKKGKKGKK